MNLNERSSRRALTACLFVFASAPAFAQDQPGARLLTQPSISGDTVAFVYGGDIWVSKTEPGSTARRLTSHIGAESRPRISPDGKHVAFSGSYDGTPELYVVPIEGGEPRRLTFDPNSERVFGWTPDGKIAYGSSAENFTRRQPRLWLVDPKGGMPIRTPLAEITDGAFFSDGRSIAYSRGYPSNWRRYRGGQQGKVSIYNFNTNAYSELPVGVEQQYYPMVVGRSVYYTSDKTRATLNLYRYDLDSNKTTQLTQYSDADVRTPTTDGKSVVWERSGSVWVYDIASAKVERLSPRIPSELLSTRPTVRSLTDFISGLSISPGGERLAVEARGELFSVPVASGDTINLTRSSGARERYPAWSPDGKEIAYIGDATGESEIYTLDPKTGTKTQLTDAKGKMTFRTIGWSPDGKLMEVRNSWNDLFVLDVAARRLTFITRLANTAMSSDWSPDSRWLAFTNLGANQLGAVHLYEVSTGKLVKATEGYYADNAVAFDLTGKYLYLRSSRTFTPGFGRFEYSFKLDNTEKLYVIPLLASTPNPLRAPDPDGPAVSAPAGNETRIDLAGFDKRVLPIPSPAGNLYSLIGGKDALLFLWSPIGSADITLSRFDLRTRETQTIFTGPNAFITLNQEATKMAWVNPPNLRVLDVKPGAAAVQVSPAGIQATVDPREEWRQMFWEAWRFQRDTFYREDMHGLDWLAIGKRYEALLPYVAHRSDLSYVLSLMINELGTSHAYVDGGDMGPGVTTVSVGQLGANYAVEGDRIRFAKIYRGESYDEARRGPLAEPGYEVQEGEYLLEINGHPVTSKVHPNSLMLGKAGQYVTLTVNSAPSLEGARRVRVKTVGNEDAVRLVDWVESTRKYVEQKSGGRIGYMHVPSVLHDGAADFIRAFYAQTDKEALIVDERWNVGGYFIQNLIVEMLNRKPILGIQARSNPDSFSLVAIEGPKAMLVNEYAGSGGDSFAYTFRAAGTGAIIGRRTLGALVGINNGVTLVDGGSVTSPENGIFDVKTGMLAAENVGVTPDIEVDMRPDLVAQGKDPQLDAAIKHLLDQLAKMPKKEPRKETPRVQAAGRVGGK